MSGWLPRSRLPRYVSGLGVLLGLEMIAEIAILSNRQLLEGESVILAGLLTSVPFVAGLIYAGFRLRRSSIDSDRYTRIGRWTVGGMLIFLLVNMAIMPTLPIHTDVQFVGWLRWASSIGASVGFLIGWIEARAIHREIVAERGRISFDQTETRRDLLEYLDTQLTHEVRGQIADIETLAENLESAESAETAAAIKRQIRGIRSILRHATRLLQEDSGTSPEPINLTAVLNDVVHDEDTRKVEFDYNPPDAEEWYVLGDRLLGDAIDTLITYLVDRIDCSTDAVFLRVDPTPEAVSLRIGCEGKSVPRAAGPALDTGAHADPDSHAPELAFVGILTEYYGGSVGVEMSEEDERVFVLRLRRVPIEGMAESGRPKSTASISD